jgi:hypothetical protein
MLQGNLKFIVTQKSEISDTTYYFQEVVIKYHIIDEY